MSRKVLSWCVATAVLVGLWTPSSARAQSDAHVVLVSIDGIAASRLDDEELELGNLRGIVRSGSRAESSETIYPGTDHPAHTSILTGVSPRVHGVIGNRVLNRETGEYYHVTNKPRSESIRVKTLFDAAKEKGLGTASFFWPETRDDPSIDRGIPLVLAGDGTPEIGAVDPKFLEELRENGVLIDLFFQWYNDLALQTTADRILTRAAAYVFKTYHPNLLALRLPAMDRYQHQYGPDHYLSKAALTAADYDVGLMRRAIEESGLSDQTTLIVVSDHGFHTVTHSVNVFPPFDQAGLLNKVNLHAGYWSVFVELGKDYDPRKDEKALLDVLGRVASLEGIAGVYGPDEFHALGLPRYEEDPRVLGQYLILGLLDTRPLIDEQSRSSRRVALPTPLYGHGYLPTDEKMYPLLVASGRRIKEGAKVGHVHNLDVAPTVAELLGIHLDGLEGRVLTEMLK